MGDDSTTLDDADRRRQSPRAGLVLRLGYRNAGHLLVSYCTNLSRGGLFVPSATPLEPGSRLRVQLSLPGHGTATELEAVVCWSRQFDASEGPAGMGLAFDDVDDVLGERIDGLVADFAPLTVYIVGDQPAVRAHVAAQVRSLVSCETVEHECDPRLAEELADGDLVVVDTDSAPEDALKLLGKLSNGSPRPPLVGLCDPRDTERHRGTLRFARVVGTPVDVDELRTCVLETVTEVIAESDPSES